MKFKCLLWVLGVLMERSSRSKPLFREELSEKEIIFQISTQDKKTARYYEIKHQRVKSVKGLHKDADFILFFINAATGYKILRANNQNTFMQGIQDQKISIEGDVSILLWFQNLLTKLF